MTFIPVLITNLSKELQRRWNVDETVEATLVIHGGDGDHLEFVNSRVETIKPRLSAFKRRKAVIQVIP